MPGAPFVHLASRVFDSAALKGSAASFKQLRLRGHALWLPPGRHTAQLR